ncbi:phosphotransferase family protein [Klenkia sp. LSe6-5]|uniref:Phosphotransferase family protein n=1 Tax=Klenkia sesuvii TaxID=3103137 RepID=A0ABU8DYT1_9ACTN
MSATSSAPVVRETDDDTGTSPTAELSPAQVQALTDRMARWLPADPPQHLQVSLLSGGRSNLTYVLTDGDREWILRRPPLGHVLATAHDMGREYRVMSALAGTDVPVPTTTGFCDDPGVIGASFYVMDRVQGSVLRTAQDMAAVPVHQAPALATAFVDSLAALHAIDPAGVGLDTFGRPEGYLQRQVRRWGTQLQSSLHRDVEGFAEFGAALTGAVPASPRSTVVHGDHRLDNAVVTLGAQPRVAALLDWEMSTLGDPLADLALSWLYWEGWAGIDNPIAATPAEVPGWPDFDTLTERYTTISGIQPHRTAWYRAFAVYKFAVICEGIHHRYTSGHTSGEGFDRIGAMVPELVDRGRDLLTADQED